MKGKSNLVFIYNILQSNFYLSKGVIPLEIGINSLTNRVWLKFNYFESQQAYEEWVKRKPD